MVKNKILLKVALKAKKLTREMKQSINIANYPIIFFKGWLDNIKKKKNIAYIFSIIALNHKKEIWLELNSYPIIDSPDRLKIFSEIHNFTSDICP
ncbi:MAG: hypothetical protein ACFFCE_05195 [Promethearchaeota archaeon]